MIVHKYGIDDDWENTLSDLQIDDAVIQILECDTYDDLKEKLKKNENFIVDLIGLNVVTDEGQNFGTVKDVLQTGANDVYVIDGNDGKEYLFPAIKECILDINLEKHEALVHIMPGLLDL